eukprot:9624170-Alexandrium_andersonii.AAC.1
MPNSRVTRRATFTSPPVDAVSSARSPASNVQMRRSYERGHPRMLPLGGWGPVAGHAAVLTIALVLGLACQH